MGPGIQLVGMDDSYDAGDGEVVVMQRRGITWVLLQHSQRLLRGLDILAQGDERTDAREAHRMNDLLSCGRGYTHGTERVILRGLLLDRDITSAPSQADESEKEECLEGASRIRAFRG